MDDMLIIGGGVIGLMTARELCLAGAKVTLLERGELARESSWAGGGIISPLYPWRYPDSITRLASWGQKIYADLCAELFEATGIDPEYTLSGLIIAAGGEEQQALEWANAHRHSLALIDAAAITALEPKRLSPPSRALWMPDVAQIRNPRLTKALIQEVKQRGVKPLPHTRVNGLKIQKNRVIGIETDAGNHSAEKILLCAGAWTGELSHGLPTPADIRPVRGQMLMFKAQPGLIRHMMLEENRYIIPRRDGRILFGSTLEEQGFDKSTTESARQELKQLATRRFPALKDYPVERHWAGLRPAAPAGVPYITAHRQIENLFINAGHYRNGVVLAPASARLMADLVLGRNPILDPAPYTLEAPRG